jgi:hypothetical protein
MSVIQGLICWYNEVIEVPQIVPGAFYLLSVLLFLSSALLTYVNHMKTDFNMLFYHNKGHVNRVVRWLNGNMWKSAGGEAEQMKINVKGIVS